MILSLTKNKHSSILLLFLLVSIFAISQVAAQQFEEMPDKRLLAGCDSNCSVCNSTGLCSACIDDDSFDLINGTCYTRYYMNGTLYTKDQHGLYFYVDANGSDVAVDVIFGILAAVAFAGFYFLAHRQDWKPWVPEPPAEAKENKGKEKVEGETDGQQPKQVSKTPKAIDDGIDLGGTNKQEGEEEEEGDAELGTKKKANGDEDEDVYYPNMKMSPSKSSKSSKSKNEDSRNNSKVEVNMEDEIEDATNAGRTSVKSIRSNFAQNTPKSVKSQLTSPKTHLSPKTMISPKSHLSPKSHISPKSQAGSKKGSPTSKRRGSKSSNAESHRSDKENEVHEEQVEEEEQEEQEEEQEEVVENDSRHDEELEEEEDNVVTLDAAFNANTQPAHTEDNDPNSSNTGFMVGSDSRRYKR